MKKQLFKRISSALLAVAMVAVMLPAALITAIATPYTGHGDGYDVYVSEEELTLDGVMDAVYENSEKIVKGYQHTAGVDFETYAVATANGIYFFSSITDDTVDVAGEAAVGAENGDRVQVYMQVANTVTTGEGDSAVTETHYDWGYFVCDYAHETSVQNANVWTASTIVDGGYTFEVCIPWSIFTDITNGFSLDTCKVWFGFQVNNYAGKINNGLAFDNLGTISYWNAPDYGCSGTTAPSKYMIPANLIKSAKVVKDLKYQSLVTDEAITLDGERDEVYLLSEKITSEKVYVGTYGETAGFNTWIVAREDGFYIFASIFDDTLDKAEAVENGLRAQDGDRFEVYLQLGSNVWQRWGYISFDYVDGGRHLTTKQTLGYATDGIQQKAVIWDDQKGWDIEIFIPHNISVDDRFGSSDINPNWNDLLMKVNFLAINETCTDWNENGYCTARNRHGLAYDIAEGASAWQGPSYKSTYFVPVDFNINHVTMPGTGALTYSESITLDGIKDNSYGDDSLAFVLDKNRSSNFTSENGNEYAKAWVTVTGSKIYLYALVNDTTLAETPSDAVCLYTYFPLTNTGTFYGGGYARDGHIDTTSRWSANAFNSTNGDGNSNIGEGQARKDFGDGWYGYEITMNLPYAEQMAIARGETIELGIGIVHKDRDASNAIKAYNRNGYESYWTHATYAKYSLQRFAVNNKSTATNMAIEPQIVQGPAIALNGIATNYYADIPVSAKNVVMKLAMDGKAYIVSGIALTSTHYEFHFDAEPENNGIMTAELYIGGKLVDINEYKYTGGVPHVWDEGVVTTPATCTEAGIKTFTCHNCGKTKTEPIAPIAHSYGEWTEYDDEQHVRECKCGEEDFDYHNFENGTCTECGYKDDSGNVVSGQCGDNLFWVLDLDTGILTISGTGEMYDYTWLTFPWYEYKENITTVIIEDGATSIGEYTFTYCDKITSLTMPDSIEAIRSDAFWGCDGLISVKIPDKVTIITSAFGNCAGLESVILPDNATRIDTWAFAYCESLKSLTIPKSVTSIGTNPFHDCYSLESIIVEEGNPVYMVSDNCLIDIEEKTIISGYNKDSKIPDDGSVEIIGRYAFFGCKELTSIIIPSAIISIEDNAFWYCRGLETVIFEEGIELEYIGDNAFGSCDSLTSITIPSSVTEIGSGVFDNCTSLERVVIEKGSKLYRIGYYAFSGCEALAKLIYCGSEEDWEAIEKGDEWNVIETHYNVTIDVQLHDYVNGVCIECGATTPPVIDTYTVTFMADGVVVDIQSYTELDMNIIEPAVPAKAGYIGVWEAYSLELCNIVVNAIYTPVTPPEDSPSLVVDGTTVLVGRTFQLPIRIENNTGVWAVAFALPIDTSVFEFVSADTSGSIFNQFGVCGFDESTNTYKFNGYNSDLMNNVTVDGNVVTLTLKVKDDATEGEYKMALALLERNIIDCDGAMVEFVKIDGSVNVLDYMLGDVNGDGYITNADVLRIFRYIYNAETYPLHEKVADVNGDGYVTNADVLRIFRYIYSSDLYPIE